MKKRHLGLLSLGLLLLMAALGCAGASTSTSNTALYVFDQDTHEVLVWKDMTTLYSNTSSGTSTSPDHVISSATYLTAMGTLAWGGMALDRSRNRLWLLSTGGKIVRIDGVRSRSGEVTSTSYIRAFRLGSDSSDRLTSGTFGQLAVDVTTGALYATEYNTDESRVWYLATPTDNADGGTVASSATFEVSGDTYGYGLAVGSNSRLYAYFGNGDSYTNNNTTYTGQRIRYGTTNSFSSALIGTSSGNKTQLATYGTLAADSSNNLLYVCKHLADGSSSDEPVAIFKNSQFTSSTYNNVAPSATLGSSSLNNLRIIAHPGNKDWLVGATSTNEEGTYSLWLWKTPSTDQSTTPLNFTYGSLIIRGIALDGSASN